MGTEQDNTVVFLMGATACGKTDLSFTLAEALNAEIVSVDSALVYRGMDIGTAKPTPIERANFVHHLIDICDPWDSYSAARFCHDALEAIRDIRARGKRALLVGGTMLYFKALEHGLADLPDADENVREELTTLAREKGWRFLHQELTRVDPIAASRIHPNDPQRLQRALEVYRLTGVALSELQSSTRSQLPQMPIKFALLPEDRGWLHARIAQRFDDMIEKGFMQEMLTLRKDPRIHAQLPAMRSVGYRQAWEHLELQAGDEPQWKEKAIAATRQLAKRQMTWLRGMDNVTMVSCDTLSLNEQMHLITQVLSTTQTLSRLSVE